MDANARAEEAVSDITVVITSIPKRKHMLKKAVQSVEDQTLQPYETIITEDNDGLGAWSNRNNGLFQVETEWTAFLDDDDWLYPQHLEKLRARQKETGADLVYPWFTGPNSNGILFLNGKTPFGQDPDPEQIRKGNWIPITYLVRTELAKSIGGFPALKSERWPNDNCEDWGFLIDFVAAGGTLAHLAEKTWHWNIHGDHTSGRPWK